MSWELDYKTKYKLPDGSIFVKESWSRDQTSQYTDFNADDELIYDDTHENKIYFEVNNGNWIVEPIFVRHPNWVKSYTTYKFKNKNATVDLKECIEIEK